MKFLKIYQNFKNEYFISSKLFDPSYIGQYHISCFLVCALHFEKKDKEKVSIVKKCLNHLQAEFNNLKYNSSSDFSIENICLAHYFSKSNVMKKLLEQFLSENSNLLKNEIYAKATDYHLLRYFNITYFNKYIGADIKVQKKTLKIVEKLSNTTGILFDSFDSKVGYPDSAYHCRNFQIFANFYCILKQNNFENVIRKSYAFLSNFSSFEGNFCFYGRSSKLVYGYAALYMAINMMKMNCEKTKGQIFCNLFLKDFIDFKNFNIFISKQNQDENFRGGKDSYVYPMVYKIFALSRIVCGEKDVFKRKIVLKNLLKKDETSIFDKETGFVNIYNKNSQIFFNLLGHPNAPIRPNDNRYLPLIPLYYSNYKLPAPTFVQCEAKPLEKIQRKVVRKFLNKYYELINNRYIGYIPIFETNGIRFFISSLEILENSASKYVLEAKTFACNGYIKKNKLNINIKVILNIDETVSFSYCLSKGINIYFPITYFKHEKIQYSGKKIILNGKEIIKFNREIKNCTNLWNSFKSVDGLTKKSLFYFNKNIDHFKIDYLLC